MDEIVPLESAYWREKVSRETISVNLAATIAARVTLGVLGKITSIHPSEGEDLLRTITERMLEAFKE